jgi:hypothetical protein
MAAKPGRQGSRGRADAAKRFAAREQCPEFKRVDTVDPARSVPQRLFKGAWCSESLFAVLDRE